jgi:ribosomal protein L7/L12
MNNWLFFALIIAVIYLSDTVLRMNKRIKRSESMLQAISKQVGVPEHQLNDELRQLIRDKEKIEAIKKVQHHMGLSLREAKDYVDSL